MKHRRWGSRICAGVLVSIVLAGVALAAGGSQAGARQIRRTLQNLVEGPLTQFLLLNPPGKRVVRVDWQAGQAEFRLERR